jgi:hypothetical protein
MLEFEAGVNFSQPTFPGLLCSSIQPYDDDRVVLVNSTETASSWSVSGLLLNDGSSGSGGH